MKTNKVLLINNNGIKLNEYLTCSDSNIHLYTVVLLMQDSIVSYCSLTKGMGWPKAVTGIWSTTSMCETVAKITLQLTGIHSETKWRNIITHLYCETK